MIGGRNNVGHGGHVPGKCGWEVRRGSLPQQGQSAQALIWSRKRGGGMCMWSRGATPLGQVEPGGPSLPSEMGKLWSLVLKKVANGPLVGGLSPQIHKGHTQRILPRPVNQLTNHVNLGFQWPRILWCIKSSFFKKLLSFIQLFCHPMDYSHQAPLSMGFPRQEYQSGLPCPTPGDHPIPGIKPYFSGGFFTTSATWVC